MVTFSRLPSLKQTSSRSNLTVPTTSPGYSGFPRSSSHRSLTGSYHQHLDHNIIRQWQEFGISPPPSPLYNLSPSTPTPTKLGKTGKIFTFENSFEKADILEARKFSKSSFSRSLRWKRAAYNFIQRPSGFWSYAYHTTIAILVLLGILFYSLSTVPDLEWWSVIVLHVLDITIVTLLTLEFITLTWAATSVVGRFRGCLGFGRFLFSPFRFLDLFVIFTSGFIIWTHWFSTSGTLKNVTWLRCAQLFQVLRLETRFKSWRLFKTVCWLERKHLLAASFLAFFVLIFHSYAMYFIELPGSGDPEKPTQFANLPLSLYWGVVTFFAIGYGDVVPVSTAGRLFEAFTVTICVVIWALPAEILATGLALKVQENRHQRQLTNRKGPAARLIQFAWRYYVTFSSLPSSSKPEVQFVATWRYRKATSAAARLKPDPHISAYGSSPNKGQPSFKTKPQNSCQLALSNVQKNAIRFIISLRFALARRAFSRALAPYDIQDVVRQYAHEHADIVERVRFMQFGVESGSDKLWKGIVGSLQRGHKQRADRIDRLQATVEKLLMAVDGKFEDNKGDENKIENYFTPPSNTPTFKVNLFPPPPTTEELENIKNVEKFYENMYTPTRPPNIFIFPDPPEVAGMAETTL